MSTGVKIVIIGAGSSQFSAGIVRDLCVNKGLYGSHVVLMDIDERRLDFIEKLAIRMAQELKADLTFSKTTDRQQALKGADFVINTVQVKAHELEGHQWVEFQRSLCEKHGYYRGARLHDYGQMAFHLEVARDVERICPDAWLIESANPVFEACTLMTRETKVKVIGLCHGHYGYREIAKVLGLDLKYVTAQTPGFNHWIWMTDFRYKGKDAYPLINEWIKSKAEEYWARDVKKFSETQMSRASIDQYKLYGLMPIGDTPRMVGWVYHNNLAAKKRWYGNLGGFDSEIGWQMYLDELSSKLSEIEQVALNENKLVSDTFKPEQSDEQIVPIINSLVNDVQGIYQVNIPNAGHILKGFPEDLVVECQAIVNGAGVRGVGVPPLPERLMTGAMIPRWHTAELKVNAMREQKYEYLLLYLLEDHRTKNLEQAESLLEEWFSDPHNDILAKMFKR